MPAVAFHIHIRQRGCRWISAAPLFFLEKGKKVKKLKGQCVLARRKPRLLFRFTGFQLLRLATRQFAGSLFHDPPRLTRLEPVKPAARVFQKYACAGRVCRRPKKWRGRLAATAPKLPVSIRPARKVVFSAKVCARHGGRFLDGSG